MAGHTKDAIAVWQSGTIFETTADSGQSVVSDGDAEAGMSPMEMLLASLAGCTGADVIDILRKKRQAVTALEVRVHGERSSEHPRVYTAIQIMFVVTGRQVDPGAVRRAVELSEQKYCSVSAMLRQTAAITCGFEIREALPAAAEPDRPLGHRVLVSKQED